MGRRLLNYTDMVIGGYLILERVAPTAGEHARLKVRHTCGYEFEVDRRSLKAHTRCPSCGTRLDEHPKGFTNVLRLEGDVLKLVQYNDYREEIRHPNLRGVTWYSVPTPKEPERARLKANPFDPTAAQPVTVRERIDELRKSSKTPEGMETELLLLRQALAKVREHSPGPSNPEPEATTPTPEEQAPEGWLELQRPNDFLFFRDDVSTDAPLPVYIKEWAAKHIHGTYRQRSLNNKLYAEHIKPKTLDLGLDDDLAESMRFDTPKEKAEFLAIAEAQKAREQARIGALKEKWAAESVAEAAQREAKQAVKQDQDYYTDPDR